MIHVTLDFNTQDELIAFFSKPQIVTAPVEINLPAAASTDAAPQPEPTPAPAARRGRPAKPKDPVPAAAPSAAGPAEGAQAVTTAAPAAEPAPSAEANPPAIVADDVRKVAQQVVEKIGSDKGMEAARKAIFEASGVKVLRDIPADKLAAVHAGLMEVLNAKS